MNAIEDLFSIGVATEEELVEMGHLTFILEEIDDAYQKCLLPLQENQQMIAEQGKKLSIVFTPLHGSGLVPVVEGLRNFGFSNVQVVSEQAVQNPHFPTVVYPNPEERSAFELAIELGKESSADLLLATDPDADRLGVAVRASNGEYELLTGNQLGALLLHYLLMQKKQNGTLPENGVVMKTIVTSQVL